MVAPFVVMANPNVYLAKAWDNRIGCAMAAETVRSISLESTLMLF